MVITISVLPFFSTYCQVYVTGAGQFIEPGSPWENGYIESFYGKMRDELLNGEIFYTLKEARIMNELWRKEYNTIRPHSSLGYLPPVPEAIMIPTTHFQLVGLT